MDPKCISLFSSPYRRKHTIYNQCPRSRVDTIWTGLVAALFCAAPTYSPSCWFLFGSNQDQTSANAPATTKTLRGKQHKGVSSSLSCSACFGRRPFSSSSSALVVVARIAEDKDDATNGRSSTPTPPFLIVFCSTRAVLETVSRQSRTITTKQKQHKQ